MAVNKDALTKFLADRGYEVNNSMDSYIDLWKGWYKGKVESFHSYRLWNGVKWLSEEMFSLQLGKTTPEQLASLLFNEKCWIAIDDGSETSGGEKDDALEAQIAGVTGENPTAEFIRQVFDKNDLYLKINEMQERKSAYGTVAYIPYFAHGRLKTNFVFADAMIPLSWENGYISELCIYSQETTRGKEYVYVQLFILEDQANGSPEDGRKTYVIENILLEEKKDRAGGAATYSAVDDISSVSTFEDVEPLIHTGSATKPFVVDKLAIANNIDPDNPLGLSLFANAIDGMKMCDTIFDSYNNEFVLGRKRIMVSEEAMGNMDGNPTFDPDEKVFYQVPVGVSKDSRPFVQELDMKIRAEEHRQAMQDALNTFSFQCGLGDNFFRYQSGGLVTATQVVSEQNVMFRTLRKHEIKLESVLVDLIRLYIETGIRNGLGDGKLNPDCKITIKFDDSIIEDKDQEVKRRMAEVAAGLYDPAAYMAWRHGTTRGAARKLMPEMTAGNNEEGMQ